MQFALFLCPFLPCFSGAPFPLHACPYHYRTPMGPHVGRRSSPSMWTENFVQQNTRWTKTSCWSQQTQRQRVIQSKPSQTTSDLCSLARQARRTTEHDSGSLRSPLPGLRYPRPGLGSALPQCLALDLVCALTQPALGVNMGTRVLSHWRGMFCRGSAVC